LHHAVVEAKIPPEARRDRAPQWSDRV